RIFRFIVRMACNRGVIWLAEALGGLAFLSTHGGMPPKRTTRKKRSLRRCRQPGRRLLGAPSDLEGRHPPRIELGVEPCCPLRLARALKGRAHGSRPTGERH